MSRKKFNNKKKTSRQHRTREAYNELEFIAELLENPERSDIKNLKGQFESNRRQKSKRPELNPRTVNQEDFIASMEDLDIYITAGVGPAGCGKTFLATMYAIKQLQEEKVDKIIITRPAVSVDEQHGFLPGDIGKKMEPWLMPIMDVFKKFYRKDEIALMMKEETIEIAPLAYMRGRDFGRSIVLADEVQLTTKSQMKMLLTRIGEGSKIIITGDLDQSDRTDDNGLRDFINKLKNNETWGLEVICFGDGDIQRHPVINEVLKLYET